MPVEGHDPAIGRHRYGDSPQLSYRRQPGNYLETAFEELDQIGNGKSARLETRSWILARLGGPIFALSVQAARNLSVRGKLGRRLMRLTMDDQSCAEENRERSQAPGLAPEQEGCG